MDEKRFSTIVKNLVVDDALFRQDMQSIEPADRCYVLVFTPRSGSTLLTHLLTRTEQLGFPDEYINPEFVRAVAHSCNSRDPVGVLEMLRRKNATSNGIFGIKARAVDIELLGNKEFFSVFSEATFFNLWRDNIVAQGVSLFRSVRTGHYHSLPGVDVPAPPAYDGEAIRYWIEHVAQCENDNVRMLAREGRKASNLRYEDFGAGGADIVDIVSGAFGVAIPDERRAVGMKSGPSRISDLWSTEAEQRFRNEEKTFVASIERCRLVKTLGAVPGRIYQSSGIPAIDVLAVNAILTRHEDDPVQRRSLSLIETIANAGSYTRRPPFSIDLSVLGEGHRQLAETYFSRVDQTHAAVNHFRLLDALVVGQGAVVTKTNILLRESAVEFLAHNKVPDGLETDINGKFRISSGPAVHVGEPTLLLKRPWYRNYGHWLVDCAAIAAMAGSLTLPQGWQIAVGKLNPGSMRNVVYETLSILLPGVPVIEVPDDEQWTFDALHYVTPVHVPPLFKLPQAMSCLRSIVLRDKVSVPASRRAIYVPRRQTSDRLLTNEDEVLGVCNDFGIEIFDPEQVRFSDQVRKFHGAKLVLGIKGAALTNALFCTPRTHVVAMSPNDFPDPFFWDLLAQNGIKYSELFGPVSDTSRGQGKNSFSVDVSHLRKILAGCLRDLGD